MRMQDRQPMQVSSRTRSGGRRFTLFEQRAGAAGDDKGRRVNGELLLNHPFGFLEVIRVDDNNVLISAGAGEQFQIELDRIIPLKGFAGGRILLMAGHTGDGVIEYDRSGIAAVISGVDQPGNA